MSANRNTLVTLVEKLGAEHRGVYAARERTGLGGISASMDVVGCSFLYMLLSFPGKVFFRW